MKLFVSFDGSYSNTVEDHFITLSHTIKFYIWCKYYVGVISHCHHHKENCRPLLGNPNVLLIVVKNYICLGSTCIANTVWELLQSESEVRTEGVHQANLDTSFILPYVFRYMPHAAVGCYRSCSMCVSPLEYILYSSPLVIVLRDISSKTSCSFLECGYLSLLVGLYLSSPEDCNHHHSIVNSFAFSIFIWSSHTALKALISSKTNPWGYSLPLCTMMRI